MNQSVISRSRRTLCSGFPLRLSSWFSPWKITILVSTFCAARAFIICIPWSTGQR